MKVQIFRHVAPGDIALGDVVLWENDLPIEIESVTRSKNGIELTGHSRLKPGTRAITLRPKDERLRVAPNPQQESGLLSKLTDAVGLDWTVELVDEYRPLILRGSAKTTSTGKANATTPTPANGESTPTAADATVS